MITIVCHCGDNIGIPNGTGADPDEQPLYHGDDNGRPTVCPLDADGDGDAEGQDRGRG
ncbi:hypothetical protein ABZ721_11660 [Streptomyces sp. NPDC006733]|uniref:hypothetical protein n=1 Tax=Streptomyces sp. NPDC006733 TaxID=3155460 RepID=UPI0033D4F936